MFETPRKEKSRINSSKSQLIKGVKRSMFFVKDK
jgi:hypothetical protein